MGRLIELVDQDYQYCLDYASGKTNIIASNNINRIIKAVADGTQYENRLKADMVAMLTEIQLEIREYHEIGCDEDCNNCRMVGCVEPVNVIKDLDIIQQKINSLKEAKDG